uniref:Uncharacterized protein n=1 Tax=Chromera velia CCMP2878 TaxID=1169474 RepID=A0A0G4FNM8_9ALVE|eukprot:Cvel_17955.t1-p1 / transcript=Cvel_17955.t1 / gene=Cvel_17955 / organism=Chromera_velia_CCMP2878 / gene_product=hypothetical protein / transcript_product=hypothetical protein / location=Cvel_scaffold1460:13045-16826(+) / protein_length=86 / sequence_SO=supercontig / SO=protein_coding / is_pseudo=false
MPRVRWISDQSIHFDPSAAPRFISYGFSLEVDPQAGLREGAAAAAARPMSVVTPFGTFDNGANDNRSEAAEPLVNEEEGEETCCLT